jgi:hypothetical protein
LKELPASSIFFYITPGILNKHGLLVKQNLTFLSKSQVKKPPLHVPQRGPYRVRCPVSRANVLFILSYLSEFTVRSSPTKTCMSPSTEPHADGKWSAVWFHKGMRMRVAC